MTPRANLQAIVLAAGKSSRFKSEQSKLSFPICGQEMILYPIKLLKNLDIPVTVIVGYQKDAIKKIVSQVDPGATYAEQVTQKGTADAVLCSKSFWNADNILILNGDCPLMTENILRDLISVHEKQGATITFVTAHNGDASLTGYGRVIRDGAIIQVIEQKEFKGDSSQECCINAGIYLIKRSFLERNLELIPPSAQTGEIYLPELMRMASEQGLRVEMSQVPFDNVRGVNTLKELWTAEHIKRSELIAHWMAQGVRFYAAQHVHLDVDVTIGAGSVIGSGVILLKGTQIGSRCFVDAFSVISNGILHDDVTVHGHTVIYDSVIHKQAQVGPFAHIRGHSSIGEQSIIGNFVEVAATTIGQKTKAKHLSYLGNAHVGNAVNIGAGTITCNYNGFSKTQTIIKDRAFIGSNCALVAPITIGNDAITAAGSTITHEVPDNALAFGRTRQENKEGYAEAIRSRHRSSDAHSKGPQCVSGATACTTSSPTVPCFGTQCVDSSCNSRIRACNVLSETL